MTMMQEILDIKSLLKKYRCTRRSENGPRHYICTLCGIAVVSLDAMTPPIYTGDRDREEVKTLVEHAASHGTKPCPVCNEFTTSAGMNRHRQSNACVALSRKFTMREQGYEYPDFTNLDGSLRELKDQLEAHMGWDDPSFAFIEHEALTARYRLVKQLGVVSVKSTRGTTYSGEDGQQRRDKQMWLREEWAPWEVCHYLDLLDSALAKKRLNASEFMSELYMFAHADADQRGAMIGGLELALEAK